ncbi:MAG: NAD(P)-dependent oxidoreductase [Ignavibacteriaceae bacterium]|jgi:nucleoside-diphosphate-sugar epimerase
MKILFTGASSFTGYWFVKELANAGHQVFTTYTKSDINKYDGIRKERIIKLNTVSEQIFNCQFGSREFIELINNENDWGLLCHHAAEITNYKNPEFDVINALNKNTLNLSLVFNNLLKRNCNTVLLTGSVFEFNEGSGSDDFRAFSPYGLSKGLTYNVFQYYSRFFNMKLGKFVIPNPFGPFEEPRFTTYLMKKWLNHNIASVNTPDYMRDNIHVDLLAKVYEAFVKKLEKSEEILHKINPSGYVETQGSFAVRFANEMRKRLNIACDLELRQQTEFLEPKIRINSESASELIPNWNEEKAWDELAEYYKNNLKVGVEN